MDKLMALNKRVNHCIFYSLLFFGWMFTFTPAYAGLIEVIAVEDKGTVTTVVGHTEFLSHMKITLHAPDWGDRAGTYERKNREVFVIDSITTQHFWNIYPAFIHIPQPPILASNITIPFFMATGEDPANLGPLPDGGSLDSASMWDGYGGSHTGTIDSFFDVFFELPLTGPNGEQYQWDPMIENMPDGNYYLSQVTMTVDEFTARVPEPSALLIVGAGMMGLLGFVRVRG